MSMENLFAEDVGKRAEAAAEYMTLPSCQSPVPECQDLWQRVWNDGENWPDSMMEIFPQWPAHAFGAANAAVVLFWHRPGLGSEGLPAGAHIGPGAPVLGGHGHPHNLFWPEYHPSPSWRLLHKYIPRISEGLGLRDPWAQMMVGCINPVPGATGEIDREANQRSAESGGAMDIVVKLCRPKVVLLAGQAVQRVRRVFCEHHPSMPVLNVAHPVCWDGFGSGTVHGPSVVSAVRRELGLEYERVHDNESKKIARKKSGSTPEKGERPATTKTDGSFADLLQRIDQPELRSFASDLKRFLPAGASVNRSKDMWVVKLSRRTIFELHSRTDHLLFAIRKPRVGDVLLIKRWCCGVLQSDRSRTSSHPYISFRVCTEEHLTNIKACLIPRLFEREG